MGIFNLFRSLFGSNTRETARISVLGQNIDIPSKEHNPRYNELIGYTELLEHFKRSTEEYGKVQSVLHRYEPSSHTRPMGAEQSHIRLLEQQVIKRAEFIQVREQFIDLFEKLEPWLMEQERLPQNEGEYAKQLLKMGMDVLEQAQKALPIRRLK